MSAKEDTIAIQADTGAIRDARLELEAELAKLDRREPDDEPPDRPETEDDEWNRQDADHYAFLNRERHR